MHPPIPQGPVLPPCCQVTPAWLFCHSLLHSSSHAGVCSASRGGLASFALRWGQDGGTMGAAPSPGPDLHGHLVPVPPHCPTSSLLSHLPHLVPSLPPPSAYLTHPHSPSSPRSPVGLREMAGQGSWGLLMGCWVPRGGPCPRRRLWVLIPSPLSLQVRSCANEKRVSESGMVVGDTVLRPFPVSPAPGHTATLAR